MHQILSLLAHKDKGMSPTCEEVLASQGQHVAETLNKALLLETEYDTNVNAIQRIIRDEVFKFEPSEVMSSLEEIVKHTSTLLQMMRRAHNPESKLALEIGVLPPSIKSNSSTSNCKRDDNNT